MTHLSPDVLLDVAEGGRPESSAPHLGECAACREQLADLRTVMSAAADVGVPEPSPLFWSHLSARVRDCVAAEGAPGPQWWHPSTWPRFAVPAFAGALALILAAVVYSPRATPPEQMPAGVVASMPFRPAPPAPPADPAPPAPPAVPALSDAASDPALELVSDLASQMDFSAASDDMLAVHAGAVDEAFGELSVDERREMQQLLRDLGQPGI